MFYKVGETTAFDSVEFIMREVDFGWLLRYLHSTGASAFFLVIYLHMFRGCCTAPTRRRASCCGCSA
jgi:ubiquinol-cytochrome c reductase cytochrome b subunit